MAKLLNVFPLSIYRASLGLTADQRAKLVECVLATEQAAQGGQQLPVHSAWLGDVKGHEFLFHDPEFRELFVAIAGAVRNYVSTLGINDTLIDFYFQRAWATITRKGQQIHEHSHEQSNISVAYYLQKPAGTGGIQFRTEHHPNEFSRGIFTPTKANLGFITKPGIATWNAVYLDPDEDDIVIFPSKTLHATVPNETDQVRISISADITTMLTETMGHETMMPHFSNWRRFEE